MKRAVQVAAKRYTHGVNSEERKHFIEILRFVLPNPEIGSILRP
jgi:hypothetical protein